MEKSKLVPFLRPELDILFVGLAPANGSSNNGHYFSVNQALWNQLFASGLINCYMDKSKADETVFGSTKVNRNKWSYGITDLVPAIAESDSAKIKPTYKDNERLCNEIIKFNPKVAILLHGKVLDKFLPFLGMANQKSNSGKLGKIIHGCETMFYNIAFPHGNAIKAIDKVKLYKEIITYLENFV